MTGHKVPAEGPDDTVWFGDKKQLELTFFNDSLLVELDGQQERPQTTLSLIEMVRLHNWLSQQLRTVTP